MGNKPLKLAIFNDGQLPLPPAKGGSVPTLIDMILKENESNHIFDIDVFSCYSKEAKKMSSCYKYSNFIYSRIQNIIRFLTNLSFKTHFKFVNLKAIPVPSAFLRKLKKNNYDVVYISGYIRGCLSILKYISKSSSLKIVHHHNVTDIINEPTLNGKQIYELADKILFCSDYAAKFASTGNEDQNKKNVTFLNGIPNITKYSTNVENNRHEIREKYKLSDEDFVILFVGRLVEYKGVFELIEAFNYVSKNNKKIKLVIAGSLTYSSNNKSAQFKRIANCCEKNESIIITGYVDNSEIYKYYQACDIVALLTKIDECFPLVGIESFAAGKPIITTRTGGVMELADSTNSIYVRKDQNMVSDLTKSLVYAINNKEKIKELGKEAYKQIEKYSQQNYFIRFVEIVMNRGK